MARNSVLYLYLLDYFIISQIKSLVSGVRFTVILQEKNHLSISLT